MKRFALSVILVAGLVLCMATVGSATTINDPWWPDGTRGTGELNFYAIYNTMYGTNFATSAALYAARGVSPDEIWIDYDGTATMRAVYSGGTQDFGYYVAAAETILYTTGSVTSFINNGDTSFNPMPDGTEWGFFDTLRDGYGPWTWYSEDGKNGGDDHMITVWVPDVGTIWDGSKWVYDNTGWKCSSHSARPQKRQIPLAGSPHIQQFIYPHPPSVTMIPISAILRENGCSGAFKKISSELAMSINSWQ